MKDKIALISGHPDPTRFYRRLTHEYADVVRGASHEVRAARGVADANARMGTCRQIATGERLSENYREETK